VVLFNAGGRPKSKRLDLARSAIDVAETICGRIRFVVLDGRVKQAVIATLMSGADCLLVTSDFEGSPGIVKEAIACNLPVVSVNVGDVRERLAGVRPSQIVSRETGEIGKVLGEVIMKGERSNGYEAIQDLTQKKTAARVLSVYERALMKNPV
jgi:glycosyltransferase involved in cell wall biosynthesis